MDSRCEGVFYRTGRGGAGQECKSIRSEAKPAGAPEKQRRQRAEGSADALPLTLQRSDARVLRVASRPLAKARVADRRSKLAARADKGRPVGSVTKGGLLRPVDELRAGCLLGRRRARAPPPGDVGCLGCNGGLDHGSTRHRDSRSSDRSRRGSHSSRDLGLGPRLASDLLRSRGSGRGVAAAGGLRGRGSGLARGGGGRGATGGLVAGRAKCS
mmetsp:Transcript_15884/g.62061  ORF Transcript_15884/g.62061 Transcript_15884/m.62061 type:complete len:214 (+) Transcript_15884:15-656(+)